VIYVDSYEQLSSALNEIRHANLGSPLVEQFIDGPEYAVDGYVIDGVLHVLAISAKVRSPKPDLLDVRVDIPARISEPLAAGLIHSATTLVRLVDMKTGMLHLEALSAPSGVMVVEFAVRAPGFAVGHKMLPWCSGVDVANLELDLALFGDSDLRPTNTRSGVLVLPYFPRDCTVLSVDSATGGWTRGHESLEVSISVKPGDALRRTRSGADRIGYILALAESGERAEAIASQAWHDLGIQTDGDFERT